MKKEGEEEQEEEKEKKKREKKKGKKTKEKTKEEKEKEEEKKRFFVCSCVSVTTPGRHNAKSGVSSSWRSSLSTRLGDLVLRRAFSAPFRQFWQFLHSPSKNDDRAQPGH